MTNELSDPGFELGALSGCWTTYVPNGGVSATVSTSVFATGTQSAAVTIGTNKVGGIKQQWTIPAGATSSYLSFHYAYVCTTPGATPPTLIISTDGSPSGSATTLATVTLTAASSATWVSYQVSLAQVAGTTQSFIIAFSNPCECLVELPCGRFLARLHPFSSCLQPRAQAVRRSTSTQ